MRTFNDEKPGDAVEFTMRIRESQRTVLRQMFLSQEETQSMLQKALERAITSADIVGIMQKEATDAIGLAVTEYFKYGEGRNIIDRAIKGILHEAIPGLFKHE